MLTATNIEVAYDQVQVLYGISFTVQPGEILCLLGRNGAGKTTTLKSIMGLLPLQTGKISLNNEDISKLPAHDIPKRGIAYVPQGRGLFTELSVQQNLEIGLMVKGSPRSTRDVVLERFPRLKERLKQRAETLSGGEQQMLAMARAMCMEPRVLLLDEPTEGLQPSMIELIRDVILEMKQRNVAIILVEQHVDAVLSIADRVAFIENGSNPETVSANELQHNSLKLRQYLGV